MKKLHIFLIIKLLLTVFSLHAQQNTTINWLEKNSNSIYNQGEIPAATDDKSIVQRAEEYLYKTLPSLRNDERSRLAIANQKESPVGYHIQFIQTFAGKEIYGSEVKINISKNNKILSLFEKTFPTSSLKSAITFPPADKNAILKLLAADAEIKVKSVFFIEGAAKLIPAYQVDYFFNKGLKHEELILNTNYKIIHRQDRNLYSGERDTVAMGFIFLPDPLSTAKRNYGAPYADNNNDTVYELDMERKLGWFKATVENDSIYLASRYAKIVDMDDPFTIPTYSKNGRFFYSRAEPGFEDVNAYYHINTFQEYIQSLGFTNLATFQLRVDPHGETSDNSEFIFNSPTDLKLMFGIGNVDDAEDADVIIHEYCHAISYSASNSAFGYERLILEEGLCDYFACSYSKSLSLYNWEKLFNWDNGNKFYDERWCITNKVYPTSITSGSVHKFADLWAGPMMDIQAGIGREKTDRLMLLALYSLSRNMKLSDAAKLIVQADSLLFEGKDVPAIANKFNKYGLLPLGYYKTGIDETQQPAEAKILSKYFSADNFLYVKFSLPQHGRVTLYDLQGKQLFSQNIINSTDLNIYVPELAKGLYILNISTEGIQQSVKLIKY